MNALGKAAAVLLICSIIVFAEGLSAGGERDMKGLNVQERVDITPLDKNMPAQVGTATFALG